MQINLPSLLLLNKLSGKNREDNSSADASNQQTTPSDKKSRRERFSNWLSPKPQDIKLFPGEKEIFRKGVVLVTDTRLAYIDPFDLMLKSYMFEHMISLHKQFYTTTIFNRRLCKALLFISLLVFLIIVTIDLLDSKSSSFNLVYLPLIASILLGLKVWSDMKPMYVIHWRMRDQTYGEIVQEPWLSERIKGDNKREEFMNELADAMNQALSAKAWWPRNGIDSEFTAAYRHPGNENSSNANSNSTSGDNSSTSESRLKLVTDNYQ